MQLDSIFTTSLDIKKRRVAENDLAFAFLTNLPITPGHTLVVPKRVITSIMEITEEELISILKLAKLVMESLRMTFGAEGFNCAWNEGEDYGQTVPHFHLHIVPRSNGDTGITNYEPREFLYRPGSRETSPETELKKIASKLRKGINQLHA